MNTLQLAINSLLQWKDTEGVKHVDRLIWIGAGGQQFLVIPVLGKRAWPSLRTKPEMDDYTIVDLASCSDEVKTHLEILPNDGLTKTMRECRDRAWAAIKDIVRDPSWSINPKKCGKVIREHAISLKGRQGAVSRGTLYKYLRRFWQRGQVLDALQPELKKCGGRGRTHEPCLKFTIADIKEPASLLKRLRTGDNPVSAFLWEQFTDRTRTRLLDSNVGPEQRRRILARQLNKLLPKRIYDQHRFSCIDLGDDLVNIASSNLKEKDLIPVNRALLQRIYPEEIADTPQSTHLFSPADFTNVSAFISLLRCGQDPVSEYLRTRITGERVRFLESQESTDKEKGLALAHGLNCVLRGNLVFEEKRFENVALSSEIKALLGESADRQKTTLLNRLLLQSAYPSHIRSSRKGLIVSRPDGFVPSKKLGRPRVYGKGNGINLGKEDIRHFEEAIQDFYIKAHLPLEAAFEKMLVLRYSLERTKGDGTKTRQAKPKEQLPTFTQFEYFYQMKMKNDKTLQEREGALNFARKHRAILGDQTKAALAPGAMYQIDSTVADVYLVHSNNPKIPIGRPTIYLVVDTFSTMIVGFHIGVENASYAVATLALWNSFRDKVELCKEYNVDIDAATWPVSNLPEAILADRGELLSHMSDALVERLGISVANTAPYRAEMKGIIERYLGILTQLLIKRLPGAVDHSDDPAKPDYRKDASLTLFDFTQLVLLAIIDYNRGWHDGYELTSDMIKADIERRPIKIWNWGIEHLVGLLRHVELDYVATALLPSVEASITPQGISIEGLKYSCPTALDDGWFSGARQSGSFRVRCHYDPYDVTQIFLLHQSRKILVCELTDRSAIGHAGSWAEYRAWKKHDKDRKQASGQRDLDRRVEVTTQSDAIIEEAKNARGKGPIDKNIDDGKKDEQILQRMASLVRKAAKLGLREEPISQPAPKVSEHEKKAANLLAQL